MKVISRNKKEIRIRVTSGEITTISPADEWIMKEFPVWGITGSRSKYIFVERPVKTEYSTLRERIYLHKVIVRPKAQEQVDHKDRDRMNNRRENLRICSVRENMANVAMRAGTSNKFKGVYDQSKYRKLEKPFASYVAYIDAKSRGQQKRKYLGYFKTAKEAAKAYNEAAKRIWGEFAFLNNV